MQDQPCVHLETEGPDDDPACDLGRSVWLECRGCAAYLPVLDDAERTRCEVWTRVMGYHRPVSAFNDGKRSEHAERLYFRERERGDE